MPACDFTRLPYLGLGGLFLAQRPLSISVDLDASRLNICAVAISALRALEPSCLRPSHQWVDEVAHRRHLLSNQLECEQLEALRNAGKDQKPGKDHRGLHPRARV